MGCYQPGFSEMKETRDATHRIVELLSAILLLQMAQEAPSAIPDAMENAKRVLGGWSD